MAVTSGQKARFKEQSQPYREVIKKITEEEQKVLEDRDKAEDDLKPYFAFKISDLYMNEITQYITINEIAQDTMKIKSEDSLDEARKSIYKILIEMEKITSSVIDLQLNEIVEFQKKFSEITDEERYNFSQRLFYLIDKCEEGYGDNSKWKLSFVEIRGRSTNVIKNILDYLKLHKFNDPRSEGFNERRKLKKMVEDSLIETANAYRKKYEIAGHSAEDMKVGMNLLKALARIYIVDRNEAAKDKIKKTIALWKKKMEDDSKQRKKK